MARKVLTVLSEFGFWGEELVGPLEVFDAKGYEVSFMTPKGKRAHALPPSMTPGYLDPPLGKVVTRRALRRRDEGYRRLAAAGQPDQPLDLVPGASLTSARRASATSWRPTTRSATKRWQELEQYDALLIVGGSGPIVDMANNQRVHDLILGFHAPTSRSPPSATASPASPSRATGRTARASSGASTSPATAWSTTTRTAPASSAPTSTWARRRIRWSTSCATPPPPDGQYHGNFGHESSTIVDYPFITGRSTPDSYLVGEDGRSARRGPEAVRLVNHGG